MSRDGCRESAFPRREATSVAARGAALVLLLSACANHDAAPAQQPQVYGPQGYAGAPPYGQPSPYGTAPQGNYGAPPQGTYGTAPPPASTAPPTRPTYTPAPYPLPAPYPTAPAPYPTMAAPYPTMAAPYPTAPYPTAPYPTAPYPTAPAPRPAPSPTTDALPPPTFGSFDINGSIPSDYMHRQPPSVMTELVGTLVANDRAKVQGIPLQIVEDPKDINAFATCDKSGGAFVAVTAPLLLIMARTSETRAYDETYGTSKYNDLANGFAKEAKTQSNITGPGPGFLPLPQALDPRKLARQQQLFDEQLAFVVGHELAHHYRGHTGCTNGAATTNTITPQDIGRLLSSTVPLFNQPNEIQADVEGTFSLLDTGSRRQGARWTEEGALMTLDFFSRLETLGVETVLLGFLLTHPAPQLRIPIVQNAAQQWRNNGGKAPALPFRF
jgi:hypothetical protein